MSGSVPESGSGAVLRSADEIAEGAIVAFRGDRPRGGWRGALYSATGGLVNPGLGAAEKQRQSHLDRIRSPLRGMHRVAVTSIKGGVGKTTVTACTGLVLAQHRGDRVIVVDADPDAGTLADRLTADTGVTVRELLTDIEHTHSLTDVARYTSVAGRLHVLASEQDPAMSEMLSEAEYTQVSELLMRYYSVALTDSGTGLVHSAMAGTLALADSLIVVGAPTVDGAGRASKTLDWLDVHGHAQQVADAVVVLCADRTSRDVDTVTIRRHFAARCRAVVDVPYDAHLAKGGQIDITALRRETHDAFLEIAAHVADNFDPARLSPRDPADEVPALTT